MDFSTVCKVLGVSLGLSEARLGVAMMSNTSERTAELLSELHQILESRVLSRKGAESLRGRLQFAGGQPFGRTLRNHLKRLSDHIRSGRKVLTTTVADALTAMKFHVERNIPPASVGKAV